MILGIGDLVRLKSGGPTLTVYGARSDGLIDCCWFVVGELHRDAFDEHELLPVIANGSPLERRSSFAPQRQA